jgi:type II secretory pathway pseudopilin PulG
MCDGSFQDRSRPVVEGSVVVVPSGLRARLGDQAGIGLVEVIMAIFILAVALLALGSTALTSLSSLRDTRDREQATNAASAAIEDARSRDFADIAHTAGDIDPSRLPPGIDPSVATTSCFGMTDPGERIVFDAVASPVPFERTAGNGGAITVHTIVTYENTDCASTDRSPLKRITVIASWRNGPDRPVVVQETQVTAVARGLPVPRFELRPSEATVRFSEPFLTDGTEPDLRRCVEHTLLNLGAEDGYDFAVESADPLTPVIRWDTYAYDVGGWRASAFLERSEDVAASRGGAPPPADDDRFTVAAGSQRPVSDLRLGSRESALLTVCWEPVNTPITVDDIPDPVDLSVVMRSRFDERQEREVTNLIRIGSDFTDPGGIPGDPLYLFEDVDFQAHPRILEPGVMSPADPDAPLGVVGRLSEHDYSPGFANWSNDVVAAEDLSGLRLSATTAPGTNPVISAHTAAWHHQFAGSTTLQRQATLVLWLAPPPALLGPVDAAGIPVGVQLRFDELRSNETPVNNGWLTTTTFEYTHTASGSGGTGGWQRVEIPIDLSQDRTFSNNRYLRMRVSCVAPSSADLTALAEHDCNLAYDNVAFPSALYVQER